MSVKRAIRAMQQIYPQHVIIEFSIMNHNYAQPTLLLLPPMVLLICNRFKPSGGSDADNKVCQDTGIICSVPMCSARLGPNRVAGLDSACFPSFIAYPSRTRDDFDQLAPFMRVPMRSGTWCKSNIADSGVGPLVDEIDKDFTSESSSGLGDTSARWGKKYRSGHVDLICGR